MPSLYRPSTDGMILCMHCKVFTNFSDVFTHWHPFSQHTTSFCLHWLAVVLQHDNNSVCGYLHRTGTLCGQCVHNYYRAAYSYTFYCIYCEESKWLLYIVVAYAPLTVFIILILIFRVSVVSPKLYGTISML